MQTKRLQLEPVMFLLKTRAKLNAESPTQSIDLIKMKIVFDFARKTF